MAEVLCKKYMKSVGVSIFEGEPESLKLGQSSEATFKGVFEGEYYMIWVKEHDIIPSLKPFEER